MRPRVSTMGLSLSIMVVSEGYGLRVLYLRWGGLSIHSLGFRLGLSKQPFYFTFVFIRIF